MTNRAKKVDITLQELTRELDLGEERFLSFTNQLSDGVIIVDNFGIVQYANPSFGELFNQKLHDIIGHPVNFHLPDGEHTQLTITRIDGERMPLMINILETIWKNNPYKIITIRNIQAESTLKRQLEIEELANEISKSFLDTPHQEIEQAIIKSLRKIGTFIEADRSYIFQFYDDSVVIQKSYEWSKRWEVDYRLNTYRNFTLEPFTWSINLLQHSEVLHIPNVALLPPQAYPERDLWLSEGVTSILAIPLIQNRKLIGLLGFNMFSETKKWYEQEETLLRLLGEIYISILARRKAFEVEQQHQQELEYLVRVSSALRQAVTLQDMVSILVDQTCEIFKARSVSIYIMEQDRLFLYGSRGQDEVQVGGCYAVEKGSPFWSAITNGEPVFIPDEESQTQTDNSILGHSRKRLSAAQVFIPLKTINSIIGLLYIAFGDPLIEITEEKKHLLVALAEMAGNALNRASIMATLEQRIIERTRNLSYLYDISAIANQNLDVNTMLDRLLPKVLESINSKTGFIHLLEKNNACLVIAAQSGLSDEVMEIVDKLSASTEPHGFYQWIMENTEPVVVPDINLEIRIPVIFRHDPALRTYIGIPIKSKGEILGFLSLFLEGPQSYTAEDIGLLTTIAEQIGSAVDSAMLQKKSEEIAVMDERQRLARELHDSVSQAIYSVTLMANAARKLSESGMTQRANYYLDELGSTAQQALKEMRLLIYELRPSALESEGLREALRQRLETVEKRAGIHASLIYNAPLELPHNAEEGLYRITLEALNNALKHAQATQITVKLEVIGNYLVLEITDDGIGFDKTQIQKKGGIGLKSMQERMEKLEGELHIFSSPKSGTSVKATIKL